jgi:hypothetical protein
MARYGRDFDRDDAFDRSRGGYWGDRSWTDRYDRNFGRGENRFGGYGRGYMEDDFSRGGFRGSRDVGMGGYGRGRGREGMGYGGMGPGQFGMRGDKGWARGYADDDRWSGQMHGGLSYRGRGDRGRYDRMYHSGGWRDAYDRDLGDRMREGWNDFKREMRRTFGGDRYDRRW